MEIERWRASMRWMAALVGGLLGFVVACGDDAGDSNGDVAVDLPGEEELRPALLSAADMPSGWAEMADSESDPFCDVHIGERLGVGELPSADVQLAEDEQFGPAIVETLGFVPQGRGPDVLPAWSEVLEECDGEEEVIAGERVRYDLGELSLPEIGEESSGARVTVRSVDDPSDAIVLDVALIRQGDLIIIIGAYDLFADTTELLITWAQAAHDKAVDVLGLDRSDERDVDDAADEDPAAVSETNGPPPPGAPLAIGETGQTGSFEVTVHDVEDPWVDTGEFPDQPRADHRFVAVEAEVTNLSDATEFLFDVEVMDSLSRPYEPAFAGYDLPQLVGDVAPGGGRRGWVTFEVPDDAQELAMRVRGDSDDGVVFDLSTSANAN
jgi:hypothetical protein